MNRVYAGTLRKEDVGRQVELAGWVHRQRDFGELVFVDLRDRSGICQIVFDENRVAESSAVRFSKSLRQEFVIRIKGEVVPRDDDRKNPEMETGDIEVLAAELEVLQQAETPPFVVDDDTTASEETRLRHRYLDLRRPVLTKNLILRDAVTHGTRDYLHEQGFLELETPILTKSTPEGARDFLVPSRVNPGRFYALPQSPQIFKQLFMVSGLDRYYQIARCFRDEDLRSDRQLEFTQVDIEASFIDEEFVFSLIEGLFEKIFPLARIEIETPFPRMSWQESMDRFGSDRPDLRFGMELARLETAVEGIEFPAFQEALASDEGIVRGIVVSGAAEEYSRKRLDELTEHARKHGAGGLIWMKFGDPGSSSIKKYAGATSTARIQEALGACDGDLALIVAGPKLSVVEALGAVRVYVARDQNVIDDNAWKFVWVVDFPLLEFDAGEGRYFARHHPFTSPRGDDLDQLERDPGKVRARAYDVVLNGVELGGGSIRIHRREVQEAMFRALGIGSEEARDRFGFLLDAFRYGAPPHGGIALGLDRIVMLMARMSSIRDVIAFPKTTSGLDLMTEAPSRVDASQLAELGLALSERGDDES